VCFAAPPHLPLNIYDCDSVSAACLGRSKFVFGYSDSQQPRPQQRHVRLQRQPAACNLQRQAPTGQPVATCSLRQRCSHQHQQPSFVTCASLPLVLQRRQLVLGLCACAASFSISDVRHMADPIEHHHSLFMTCALQRHRIYH
jgi:hypothetical protein